MSLHSNRNPKLRQVTSIRTQLRKKVTEDMEFERMMQGNINNQISSVFKKIIKVKVQHKKRGLGEDG